MLVSTAHKAQCHAMPPLKPRASFSGPAPGASGRDVFRPENEAPPRQSQDGVPTLGFRLEEQLGRDL
jgi:hypothetical protein